MALASMKNKPGKGLLMVLALSLLALLMVTGCAPKSDTIKIGAIFSITGGGSFLGAPEEKTVKMLVDEINAGGGVNGQKIELIIKDSAGNPENATSFAKQLVEENKVMAIIGPSTSGETMAIKKYCDDNKTILVSCAAAETIVQPQLPYVFKTPQKDSYAAIMIFQTMKKMGISKIGVVTSNDGFGAGGKAQLEKYAPENLIEILISEVYDKGSTDLTGVLTKLKDKGVQAVVNWSIVPAQSIVAKNMKQLGMTVPLFQSHGFGNIKYVEAAGEAAEGIIFPCGRLLLADVLPADHPQKALLLKYKTDYETKYGESVSTFGGHAYDAIILLVNAIKKAGSSDTAKVRDAIEGLSFVGTGGMFNYTTTDHNGLAMDSFEMQTVKGGKFVPLNN
jgi:branched-chain amino acid transport system substrate-binding protein